MLLFVCLLLASCKDTDSSVKTFTLDKTDYENWDNLFRVEDAVALCGTDSKFVTYCSKCIVLQDRTYWVDYKTKSLYCFSPDGTLLQKIGEIGRATSEYSGIKDLIVDEAANEVKILDDRGLICYDAKGGKFLRRESFSSENPSEYERCCAVGNGSYLCVSSGNEYKIFLDTPDGQTGVRKNDAYNLVVETFYSYDNVCRVLPGYGQFTIDTYKDNTLVPTYQIDLGSNALPDKYRPQTADEFMKIDEMPEYFKCIVEAHETKSWLQLQMVGPQQTYYTAFINKESGKYVCGPGMSGFQIVGGNGDGFYAVVYPGGLPEDSNMQQEIESKNLRDTTSPILVSLKLNETEM
jgi:hypothetical protein